jgi:hypothetical protein
LAAAGLLVSTGIALAQTPTPRGSDATAPAATQGRKGGMTNGAGQGGTTGMSGAPTNPNPQSGTGAGGLQSATPPATGSGGPATSPTPGGTTRLVCDLRNEELRLLFFV